MYAPYLYLLTVLKSILSVGDVFRNFVARNVARKRGEEEEQDEQEEEVD